MKIGFRDVEPFLAAPDRRFRAALVYGPDHGLARERANRIKAAVLTGNADPFACVELPQELVLDDPARLNDELLAMGLMASKRLVVVSGASDKLLSAIKGVAPSLHDQAFLLVAAGELSARSALRDWFEKTPEAAAVACYRDEARDIQTIVKQTFSKENIAADGDVAEFLCLSLGNDREVTRSELEKIVTFAGKEKKISLEDVRSLVDYNRDTGLDDIVMATADKNLAGLDKMLSVHAREGAAPVAYLRALSRYFNRLYFIKSQMAAGYDIETVIANLKPKVFYKHVPPLTKHARNWSLENVVRALKLLAAAELAIKTTDMPAEAASARRLYQIAQMR